MGATEGLAYWWMHPAPAGLDQPVLCYRPGAGGQRPATSSLTSDLRPPTSDLPSSTISSSSLASCVSSPSTFTLLPDVAARSLPRLGATTGVVARIDRADNVTIHAAFFEWDLIGSKSITVLEAFIHLPEECMGSIGMKLIEHQPPHSYQVGSETLTFDHTVFRDPGGILVHTFKSTWVSGTSTLIGNGVRGGMNQWRQLHFGMALKRFRPAYSRVAQGAVRGIANPALAWQAFQDTMLVDLKFENR